MGIVTPQPEPDMAPPEVKAMLTAARRSHPLYRSVALQLVSEILNSRLFTTVRDTLGLTYDVSFELALYDRLRTGWFSVNVTSQPNKIDQARNAGPLLGARLSFRAPA